MKWNKQDTGARNTQTPDFSKKYTHIAGRGIASGVCDRCLPFLSTEAYDKAGNIMTLLRNGLIDINAEGQGIYGETDHLTYLYTAPAHKSRLTKIIDTA